MLDFDVIDSWYAEPKRMNYGKKDVQYYYPNPFVELLGYMRIYFHLPYKQTEGFVRSHANEKVPSIPDYNTLNRRVNNLDIKINEKVDNDIVIALASTRIKVANIEENGCSTNDGILEKGICRDMCVAVDIKKKKKIVSLKVSSEEVPDSQMLKKLIYNALNNVVKRVLWLMVHMTQ
jgi:Transposase DDE domain